MHAGTQRNQSLRAFDQCRQNGGREHIDSKDARTSGLHLHPPLAITDARIVDYSVETAEPVDLVGNCSCPSDGREVSGDNSPGAGCCRERVATRPSFRPCNTTSWPWSIRSRAAMRPRPSDDPVMNTRATSYLLSSGRPFRLTIPNISLHSARRRRGSTTAPKGRPLTWEKSREKRRRGKLAARARRISVSMPST